MNRRKINPALAFTNNVYEMEDRPNNQPDDEPRQSEGKLDNLRNVGNIVGAWKNYTNKRRIARARRVLGRAGQGALSRSMSGIGLAQDLNEEEYGWSKAGVDRTTDIIKQQMETAPNRNLIQYFARLSNPGKMESLVDLEFVASLIDDGADINCTDKYGQTVLHEVARTWHVDVAKYLVCELKADPNQGDNWGRTPLHVAASVDYADMCNCLIDLKSNMEAESKGEKQTPVFYAARNDSVNAIRCLIKRGCEYKKVVDYKNRTPLTVAAELDRSETAKILLENGAPADVRDDSGQPVMVLLIMKMAPVAKEALNQFHQKDRANRKQYYYLGRLDPTQPEEINNKKYPSVLQMIVTNRQYELAMHPSLLRLINYCWDNVAKWRAFRNLFFQFAYIVSWSIFGVAHDWTERYKYNLPVDIWRIIIFIIAVFLTVWQIVEEVLEYRSSNKKHEEWKNWRLQQIDRDEEYCHPRWPEEIEYLEQEKDELDSMAPSYFSDLWNYFDWLCYIMLLVCIITHLVDVFAHSLIIARWHIRIMAVTVIILWLRFMKVCRAFALVGPFIVILGHMLRDVIRFLFLYLDFYIPFAFAFWMLLGGKDNIPESSITNTAIKPNVTIKVSQFDQVHNLLFAMFRMTLVDDYDYDNMILVDHVMAQLLVGSWLAISAILCINLFIALLSDTFQRVYDNAQANAVMQKAMTILNIMDNLSSERRRRFHELLLENCNPETMYYDDDTTVSGEEDLRRATIETRDTLNDMKERFDSYFGVDGDDGDMSSPRRQSLAASAKVASFGKIQPSLPTQFSMKNLNTITMDTFEHEMEILRDELSTVRNEQLRINENMTNQLTAMKSILQDIAVVITGGMTPTSVEKTKKKKRGGARSGEAEDGSVTEIAPPGLIRVAPAPHPTVLETYTSDGTAFLSPLTFPGPSESKDV